jgi:hypothetical protein
MAEKQTTTETDKESQKQHEVVINYLKSNFFRVIHADGAWGGISPRGDIHISFYNERSALPDISRFTLSEEGQIAQPEFFKSNSKVIREIEADVIMDLGTAQALRNWLSERITLLEKLIKAEEEKQRQEVKKDA